MTSFNNTWEALLKPGVATTYFDVHRHKPFQANVTSYSQVNAWWLAELCRLIYRQEHDEIGHEAQPPIRNQILHDIGLQENAFFNRKGTQCAIVSPSNRGQGDFVLLVFRGTNHLEDWGDNLKALSLSDFQPECWPRGGQVHVGFREALDRVWDKINQHLDGRQIPLFYTGHSLGAALATLAASRRPPSALYTFGSPRVGDQAFAATLSDLPVFRVVNNRDVVTALPPPIRGFCHVGEVHYIAHDGHILTNPPEDAIAADRQMEDPTFDIKRSWLDRLVGPPQFLADHAPVNYVAHLERDLSRAR
jgi:hypothetical protein